MCKTRLSKSLCKVVGDAIGNTGSHATLDMLFQNAGASGDPPDLAHTVKWKEWLFRTGMDPEVDSLAVLGSILEEFMDVPPNPFSEEYGDWEDQRKEIEQVLEENGFRYFRFGRVLPQGNNPEPSHSDAQTTLPSQAAKPTKIEELLMVIVNGLRRAMHPLTHRRKGSQPLTFSSEYDVQDLIHAMLRPWISDVRAEEFTPSYAGSSTRMDFLLPAYNLVLEMKFVRDRHHAKKIGDELIIDIEHYRAHPNCATLWCVIYDHDHLIANAEGIRTDLEGKRSKDRSEVDVKVIVV